MVTSVDKVVLDAQLKHNKERLNEYSKDQNIDENVRKALDSVSMVANKDNDDVQLTKIEQGKGEFKNHFDIEATTKDGVVTVSVNPNEWKVKDTKNVQFEGDVADYKNLNKTFDDSVTDYEKLEKEYNQNRLNDGDFRAEQVELKFDDKFKLESVNLLQDKNAKNLIKDFPDSDYSKLTNLESGNTLYIAVTDADNANPKEVASLITYDKNNDDLSQTDTLKHVGINFNLVTQEHLDFLKKDNLQAQDKTEESLSDGLLRDGGLYVKSSSYENASRFLEKDSWEEIYNYSIEKEKSRELELIEQPDSQQKPTSTKAIENSIEQDIERTIDVAKEAAKIDKTDVAKYGASVAVDNVTGLGAVKVPVEATIATHNAYDAIDKGVEVNKALNKEDKSNPPKDEPKEVNDPVEPKGKKDQDTGDKTPPKTEEEIPKTLLNKYHLVDHKFHYRNDPDKVAFEDTGKTLKTDTNDKEIARSMVELAEAKKWDTIQLKGTEEFKRTVWLEASLKGMNVKGYEPKDVDIAMLNDLKKPDQEIKNTIERGEDRLKEITKEKAVEPKSLTQTPEEVRQEKMQNLSEKERALLTIFDRKMQAENFNEKQRAVSMDQAIDQLHDKKIHVGKLVDHGHAPYKNDPKNNQSYFATLENEKGQKHTLWAKDLERTLREQNIIKNDDIVLTYKGSKQVEVDTKEINPKTGLSTGHRVHTVANRGKWEAQSLSKLKATTEKELTKNHQTKLQVQHEAELKQSRSFSQPKIQAYSATAPKQQPQVQQQKQTKEREKNKEIPR